MQLAAVAVVVACAVAYAAWLAYRKLRHPQSACEGCALAEACAKKRRCNKIV